MSKKIALFALCLLFAFTANAQNSKKAQKLYNSEDYPSVIKECKQLLSSDKSTSIQIMLANSYRLTKDYQAAEEVYAQLFQTTSTIPTIEYYNYGSVLKINKNYDKARQIFTTYYQLAPNEPKLQLDALDNIEKFGKDSGQYLLTNININSRLADFGAAPYKTGIIFASENGAKSKKLYPRRNAPYLDLFYAPLSNANSISEFSKIQSVPFENVNSNYHDAALSFDNNGTMYFTTNSHSKKLANGLRVLQIYDSNGKPMPFNSDKYSTGHPSLTIDGSTMYFISDMPGGYGGTDIYVVYKSGNGWGKPINLGYTINTTTDEMFPFIASDGTLYFSSDGLPGLGGLDVFKSTKNGTEWTKPENLHAPINSNNDDFAFTIDAKRNQGYLSSNRSGGKGNDDIYAFVPAKAPQVNCLLKGKITERNTNMPIADATVKLISMSNGMEQSVVTGSDGVYIFDLNPESNYTIYATKKGYFTEVKTLSTIGKNCSSPLEQNLQIDISVSKIPDGPIKIIAGQDDNSGLPLPKINHIYYDFDKADIRPDAQMELDKIVTFMKDNPDMIIELGSHTDSRGKADYNLDLSQRRAASAVAYIVSQGIEQERITAKGYGETTPVNKCKDGVTCTETEHQQNRRTEFLIRFKK